MLVSEFQELDHINTQLLVVNVSKGVNNGAPYLNIELRDASGSINAKKWSVTSEDENIFVAGNVIEVAAEVIKYKDVLQLKVSEGQLVPLEEIDVAKFVKAPPIKKEELIKRFNAHVDSIKNPDCSALLRYFINKYQDKLLEYPAAMSVHHEYSSGLLMHSVSMADIADNLAKMYDADRDILITGCLLHDFGKMIEYVGPIVFKQTVEGKLVGHISIMSAEIINAAKELNITSEVPLLLQHMILSHHGTHEFGSPVLPLTKEALLLSLIDNLDSKMVIVNKALETVNPGEFSQKVFPLDNRTFYKPKN